MPEVAAGDHDRVGDGEDLVGLLDRRGRLDLRHHLRAVGAEGVDEALHVGGPLDERGGHRVGAGGVGGPGELEVAGGGTGDAADAVGQVEAGPALEPPAALDDDLGACLCAVTGGLGRQRPRTPRPRRQPRPGRPGAGPSRSRSTPMTSSPLSGAPQRSSSRSPGATWTPRSGNGAMRSFGPGRSTSTPTVRCSSALTRRTRSTSASWAAGSPWDRLTRITSAPAAMTFRRTGSSHEAGPMDATIFVRRTACPSTSRARARRHP